MSILALIASDNYIAVNRKLAIALGLEEAVILGELASEHNYWVKEDKLDEDGYFFSTVENVEKNTTIKEARQRKAINCLKNMGILDVKLKGLPAKRYIKINEEQLVPILLDNFNVDERTSSAKMEELEPLDEKTNKNNINNNIINKNNLIKDIISYLNEKLGSRYSYKTSKTQSLLNARFNENDYTLDDFKAVIDKKINEWKGTDMEKYLRPETLFGTKFEGYLNQATTKKTTNNTIGIDTSKFGVKY